MVDAAVRARVLGLAAVGVLLAGCYTLQPAGRLIPEVGATIALSVNDAGRVALGGTMGPEIDQVEGQLVQKDNEEYVLAVSLVRLLRGGEQKWNSERIRIRTEHVGAVYERRFSQGRSVVMGAIGLGAVYFLVSRAIVGSGLGEPMKMPPDTSHSIRRLP